jgi:hypothetical protein
MSGHLQLAIYRIMIALVQVSAFRVLSSTARSRGLMLVAVSATAPGNATHVDPIETLPVAVR